MSSLILTTNQSNVSSYHKNFSQQQIDILKNSICKGVSNEEFEIFLMACAKTQLDPFMRQIYAVKRKAKKADGTWGETMTIQTGIDGYRLIAERTGCYAPGEEPSYVLDENKQLVSATAYIKKQTKDGTWHSVSASAYLDEYMQTFVDRSTGEKRPTGMWVNMQKTMLAKCAEAQALRKAFPAEMSGVYTKEEMQQAETLTEDLTHIESYENKTIEEQVTPERIHKLNELLKECSPEYNLIINKFIKGQGVKFISDLPISTIRRIEERAKSEKELYSPILAELNKLNTITAQEIIEAVNE